MPEENKMNWQDISYKGEMVLSVMEQLIKDFKKIAESPEETKNYDLEIKLSHAIGYQVQVFSALIKNHEFERRLQTIEKDLSPKSLVAMSGYALR